MLRLAILAMALPLAAAQDPPGATPTVKELSAEDQERADELESSVEEARSRDLWPDALAESDKLLALYRTQLGADHEKTAEYAWKARVLRRVSALSRQDRVKFGAARIRLGVGLNLRRDGRGDLARPIIEESSRIIAGLVDDAPELFEAYSAMGFIDGEADDQAAAERHFREALKIRRRNLPGNDPGGCTTALSLVTTLREQGKNEEAWPILQQELAYLKIRQGENSMEVGYVKGQLAAVLLALGKRQEALSFAESAVSILRRYRGENEAEFNQRLATLAEILGKLRRPREAIGPARENLAITRRIRGEDDVFTLLALNRVGACLDELGEYREAQANFEEAINTLRRNRLEDTEFAGACYSNLGSSLTSQGHYAEGLPFLEKSFEILTKVLGRDNPRTILCLWKMANALDGQGKHPEAQPMHEEALARCRVRPGGADSPDTAISLDNLATNLRYQGKFKEAAPFYETSYRIHSRLPEDHPDRLINMHDYAINLGSLGETGKARAILEAAIAIGEKLADGDRFDVAESYRSLGDILLDQGDYPGTLAAIENALRHTRAKLGDDHPKTVGYLAFKADLLSQQGKDDEARVLLEQSARGFEAARRRSAVSGLERGAGPGSSNPLPDLAVLQARLGHPDEAWRRFEESLGRGLLDELSVRRDARINAEDRKQGQALAAELEQLDRLMEAIPPVGDDPKRIEQREDFRARRARAKTALDEFSLRIDRDYGSIDGEVDTLAKIQEKLPVDTALISWLDQSPIGPRPTLPGGEHWGVVVRAKGGPHWVRLKGTGKDGAWSADDWALTKSVGETLTTRPRADAALPAECARLRAQRLDPLKPHLAADRSLGLPAARRLVVLPGSSTMALLPIEVLLNPEDRWTVSYAPSATLLTRIRERPRAAGPRSLLALGDPVFEIEKAEPRPIPDRGLLVREVVPGGNADRSRIKAGDVLRSYDGTPLNQFSDLAVVAEPGRKIPVEIWRDGRVGRYDVDPGKLNVALDRQPAPVALGEERRDSALMARARGGAEHFERLEATAFETRAIARLFRDAGHLAKELTREAVNEPDFVRMASNGELKAYSHIQLATHAVVDPASPDRSAVILSQTNLPDPIEQFLNNKPVYDGRISVREIRRGWELRADLVTLSACETARGRYAGGEGFIGFAQALLMSGTRSVCLSLWNVDDSATALLMTRFYANLLGESGRTPPMPKAEALAEAKGWLRGLGRNDVARLTADLIGGVDRGKGTPLPPAQGSKPGTEKPTTANDRPYAHPYYWAAFVLQGDAD